MLESFPGRSSTKPESVKSVLGRILLGMSLLLCGVLAPGLVQGATPGAEPDSAVAENNQAAETYLDSAGQTIDAADSMIQRIARTDSGSASLPLDLPYQQPENVFSIWNVSMVLVVIGMLVLFLHFMRKFLYRPLGGGISGGQFQVIRQYHLGPKKSVTLVRFANKLLLLGVTDSNISTLAEIDDPDEVDRMIKDASGSNVEQGGGFKDIYNNLLSRSKKNS